MFQYRQVLVRMRQGDTDREIARARLMGRRKAAHLREVAGERGWLGPAAALPDDEAIAAAIGQARRAKSTISSAEPHRTLVERWVGQGVSGVAIHAALKREHGYTGSYSSVYRMLVAMNATRPPDATVPLYFAPAEAAQVDFGAGPVLVDPAIGAPRRTWCFVMTLCFSRHQYVEFVWDQTVATWLGCHRRAFEWFGAVPETIAALDGAEAARLLPKIRHVVENYRFRNYGDYNAWPGPNSNTFVQAVLDAVPELKTVLPPTAIGKDYPYRGAWFGLTPSGTGAYASAGGYLGLTIGWVEGLEINFLGAVVGLDIRRPALKLPGIGRLGMMAGI
mgnify:CR=1 FL=1